jgi:hypothetical protein
MIGGYWSAAHSSELRARQSAQEKMINRLRQYNKSKDKNTGKRVTTPGLVDRRQDESKNLQRRWIEENAALEGMVLQNSRLNEPRLKSK